MLNTAILVKNLTKKYLINSLDFKSFRKDFINFINFNKVNNGINEINNNSISALKNINFEINKGDIVGIIGQNGAGKSTFLKVLTGITEPTDGEIYYNGKLISMLSLNVSIAGDCTAKENIYFLASMHGFNKNQIDEKLEDILRFGEMSKFIDTPVKKFSSGMTARLVFSTIVNFKPDILVVDEVLANTDDSFKNKCILKFRELNESGTTILFVSHEETLVKKLCNFGVLFDKGISSEKIDIKKCFIEYEKLKNL